MFLGLQPLLALLLASTSANRLTPRGLSSSQCAAEDGCLSSACSDAFARTDLPVEAYYTWSATQTNSTLAMVVCTEPCHGETSTCSPLQSITLRLSDALLSGSHKFTAEEAGDNVNSCSDAGRGYRWTGSSLGALAFEEPDEVGFDFTSLPS